MKDWKGTKGDWKAIKLEGCDYEVISNGKEICWLVFNESSEVEQEADAHLIADAGTTINKCGVMPSELLNQRDSLLKSLKGIIDPLTGLVYDKIARYMNEEDAVAIEEELDKALKC